jgi:hypothetical protein
MTRKGEVPRGIVPPSCFPLGNSTSCSPAVSAASATASALASPKGVFKKYSRILHPSSSHRSSQGQQRQAFHHIFRAIITRDFSAAG